VASLMATPKRQAGQLAALTANRTNGGDA